MSEQGNPDETPLESGPAFPRGGVYALLGATVTLCMVPWPNGTIGLGAGLGTSLGLLSLLAALGCILAGPLPQYRDLRVGPLSVNQIALLSAAVSVVLLFLGFAKFISSASSPLPSVYSLCIAGATTWVAYTRNKARDSPRSAVTDFSAASMLSRRKKPDSVQAGEGWFDDPSGRFTSRYFDGDDWTEWVLVDGQPIADPTFPPD